MKAVCRNNPDQTVLQLGDFGVGFSPIHYVNSIIPDNFRFFVGNHDNRSLAPEVKGYLGDFGELEDVFFVSGADSIDKVHRVEGVNWWRDEELSYQQASLCLDAWATSQKRILVSHDTTQSFVEAFFLIYDRSLTRNLLQSMIEVRKPDMVISGHHHKKLRKHFNGIEYVNLGIDEYFQL